MAKYIKSLSIETFRGIKNLELKDFGDVNIFTGGNNCGKTSVLEVLKTIQYPYQMSEWLKVGMRTPYMRLSNISFYEALNNLFDVEAKEKRIKYSYETSKYKSYIVELEQKVENVSLTKSDMMDIDKLGALGIVEAEDPDDWIEDNIKKMQIDFKKNSHSIGKEYMYDFQRTASLCLNKKLVNRNFVYIYPEVHLLNNYYLDEILNDSELYQELLNILKTFDEDIVSINATRERGSNKVVYKLLSKQHKNAIPINMYGDGMKKALILMGAVCACKNGVLIIDEFETGIHTSGMGQIFSWLIQTCKKMNIQVFLSSHSIEEIEKLIKSTNGINVDMKLYTLYRESGENLVRNMDAREAIKFYDEMGLELR